jgi:hypothetical protein
LIDINRFISATSESPCQVLLNSDPSSAQLGFAASHDIFHAELTPPQSMCAGYSRRFPRTAATRDPPILLPPHRWLLPRPTAPQQKSSFTFLTGPPDSPTLLSPHSPTLLSSQTAATSSASIRRTAPAMARPSAPWCCSPGPSPPRLTSSASPLRALNVTYEHNKT